MDRCSYPRRFAANAYATGHGGSLFALVAALEGDARIRQELRVIADPLLVRRGERIHLRDRSEADSIRGTAAVRHVLSMARRPVRYSIVVAELLATPGAIPAKARDSSNSCWTDRCC